MKQIPLHGVNGEERFALVDNEDYEFLMKWRWFVNYAKTSNNYYILCNYNAGNGKWISLKMHQLLLGKKEGYVIDHIDGNTFNNQKSNLRFCTRQQNSLNKRKYKVGSSKYKGVSKLENTWIARIQKYGKSIFLGRFPLTDDGEYQAHLIYQKAAIELFGEFVRSSDYTPEPSKTRTVKLKELSINTISLPPNSKAIPLSKGKHAIVDESDYETLMQWSWCAKQCEPKTYFMAIRNSKRIAGQKRKQIQMHNFLMNPPEGLVVDHINRNPLDNRRENLRIVTWKENYANRGYTKRKNQSSKSNASSAIS